MMVKALKLQLDTAHNPSAVPLNGQYHMEVLRKRLTADEVYASNTRYDPTSGQVQWTPDGVNWYAAPNLDPRNSTSVPKRPDATTDNCPAAKSVAEYFKRYISLVVSILQAGSTLVQGVSAIVAFLNVLGGYGILWDIVAGMFGTLVGYGATAISTAFTDDQYDKLKCVLYCCMSGGQLDANSLIVVKQQVSSKLNATAAPIVNLMLDVMGFAGVNRAATFYTLPGDCSACPSCSWSIAIDLTWLWGLSQQANCPSGGSCPNQLSWSPQGVLGTYSGRPAWLGQKTLGDNALRFGRSFPLAIPAGSTLTNITFWAKRTSGNMDNFSKIIWPLDRSQSCQWGAFWPGYQTATLNVNGPYQVQVYIGIGSYVGNDPGTLIIDQIRITGTGNRPAIPYVTDIH